VNAVPAFQYFLPSFFQIPTARPEAISQEGRGPPKIPRHPGTRTKEAIDLDEEGGGARFKRVQLQAHRTHSGTRFAQLQIGMLINGLNRTWILIALILAL
jgi:hypothetical protein